MLIGDGLATMIPVSGKDEAARRLNQGISSQAGTHSTQRWPRI